MISLVDTASQGVPTPTRLLAYSLFAGVGFDAVTQYVCKCLEQLGLSRVLLAYGKRSQCDRDWTSYLRSRSHSKESIYRSAEQARSK